MKVRDNSSSVLFGSQCQSSQGFGCPFSKGFFFLGLVLLPSFCELEEDEQQDNELWVILFNANSKRGSTFQQLPHYSSQELLSAVSTVNSLKVDSTIRLFNLEEPYFDRAPKKK